MDIACVQLDIPDTEPKARRLERVLRRVDEAANADLVVLPELWPTGYFDFDSYGASAERLDGPTMSAMRNRAQQHRIHLMAGTFVERHDEGLSNCAVFIDPTGEIVHTYRKIHLFGYGSRESSLLTPGHTATATTTALGSVATTTCYDLRFPELYRVLVDAGAELVIVPAAWPAARLGHWRLLVQARAVEEQIFLIACNGAGTQSGTELAGHSMVVDPWGEILAEAGAGEEILRATIDLEHVSKVRAEFPVLEHRRITVDGGRVLRGDQDAG